MQQGSEEQTSECYVLRNECQGHACLERVARRHIYCIFCMYDFSANPCLDMLDLNHLKMYYRGV